MTLDLHIAQRKEIVFIENDVADWQAIAAQAGAGREVIVLDAAGDGLQQMAQALQGRSGIDALHVITHGAEGKLDLGTLALDSTTAAARSSLLAAIGASLAPHGDILLYGCDVGAGQGASFVDRLAIATGADVAASANPTGAAGLGGDWNLEIAHGSIETAPVVDAALAAQYRHILAITAPKTLTFTSVPPTYGTGASSDLAYAIPGQSGYTLDFDGAADAVSGTGTGTVLLSPHSVETSVTIGFHTGQVFTPTDLDLKGAYLSGYQNLTFTGKDTHGHTVKSTTVNVFPDGSNWTHATLTGFTDIASLVITPASGTIQSVLVDNLVLASAHVPPPEVATVWTNTATGAYKAGTSITVNVEFDQAVTIDTTGGAPTLKLETGTTDRNATYVGTSGDRTLVFDYVVQPGDTSADLDYSGTTALALNGATVKSVSSGLDADTTLAAPGTITSLAGLHDIVIDTTAPNTPSAPDLTPGSDTGWSTSDNITRDATPTFTGTVSGTDATTVTLYDEDMHAIGSGAVSNGSYTITPTSPLADGNHAIMAIATDAAGNASATSAGISVTIDTSAPTVTITSGAAATLKAGDTATVTFTFSEDPGTTFTWNGSAGDVAVSGGTLGALSGTGNVRTATFTPTANTNNGTGSVVVNGSSYADAAGNPGAAGTALHIAYDTQAPTLTIATDKPALAAGETATITFVFSEDPGSTFTADDVAVSGGTLSALSGSGTTRSATFTPDAGVASGSANIAVAALDYADAAGNTGNAASLTFVFHTLAPAAPAQVALDSASDTGWSDTDGITNRTQLAFSGTATPGIAVRLYDGTTQVGSGTADGAGNWTITTATLSEGAHTVVAKTVDGYGNASAPSAAVPVVVDTTAPTLAIASDKPTLKAGDTATITFTFSEDPGATFAAADVAVSGGTLSALSGSGTVRTAVFTPAANLDNQTASIAVAAGSYLDAAGNAGGAGTPASIYYDTLVPGAPAAPRLDAASHTGAAPADGITNLARPTIEGVADAHAVIMVYDGTTRMVGVTIADGAGAWHLQADTLADGYHVLYAVQSDAIGNVSPFGAPLVVPVDTQAPAAPAAPLLAAASDSGTPGDRITKVATPVFNGTAVPSAQVTLYDTDGHTAIGSTHADAAGNWIITTSPLADGTHDVTVRQADAAGNWSAPSQAVALTVDTTPPSAPSAPQLQPQSDTGVRGDGVTYAVPVLAGSAAAGDLVTLYDGATAVGTAHAGTDGKWTIAAQGLHVGRHTLTATSTDVAGNVSAASGAFALTVEDAPVPLVDGVPVVTLPVLLPGGGSGTQVQVPIVSAGRTDAGGAPATADIPLADALTAHLAPGYGLTATGGPVTTAADGGAALIAAIQAAAGTGAAPLAGTGQGYLAQLAGSQPLLVQTIAPLTGPTAPGGTLTLSGTGGAQQHVALVIEAGAMAGGTIVLQDVDFAAVVGKATVVAQPGTAMLTGDAAAQDFTVQSGSGTQLFAGGGNDLLRFGASAAGVAHAADGATAAQGDSAAPTTTLLHGGSGDDTAVFAGARADFDVETHHGYLVVRSKAAPAAQALVVNVEHLQFSDATVAAQDGAGLAPLTGLYQAVLGRQADIHGLDF